MNLPNKEDSTFEGEIIVDNISDFDGEELYSYKLIFFNINDLQLDFLIAHIDDYAWENGLAISKCTLTKDKEKCEFSFKSIKNFEYKEEEDWQEEDLDKNLLTRMIRKEQFLSNIFYKSIDIEEKKVIFVDDNGKDYEVEISKYSGLTKI